MPKEDKEEDVLSAFNSIYRHEFGCSVFTGGNSTYGRGTCAQANISVDRKNAGRSASHNEIQRDEEVQEMITFQPNSQDQQSTNI
jgi:hypothetical protein